MKTIFPDIEIKQYKTPEQGIHFLTSLRLKHEGKWYLQNFFRSYALKKITPKHREELLIKFIREVYINLLFTKVNPNIVSGNLPVFELDEDQQPEEERLELIKMI